MDYRAYRKNDPHIRNVIEKIAEVASEITEGYPIKFERIGEDNEGLFPEFSTPAGTMPLNCLSQGTQSIIYTVAQLFIGFAEYYDYPKNINDMSGILIVDEIDSHLHPSWQRRFLPSINKHFKNLQIFCSTHSPLVLGGLKSGQIHLLSRLEDGNIKATRNQMDILGWTVDEVLRNLLDLPMPTDVYTEDSINRIKKLKGLKRLNKNQKDELRKLTAELNADLLEGSAAAQMKKMIEIINLKK